MIGLNEHEHALDHPQFTFSLLMFLNLMNLAFCMLWAVVFSENFFSALNTYTQCTNRQLRKFFTHLVDSKFNLVINHSLKKQVSRLLNSVNVG